MRRFLWMVLGLALAFAAVFTAIAAAGLLALGVGGGLLVRARPGATRVINYDPSTIVALSPAVGLLAIAFGATFFVLARRARGSGQPRNRANHG